MSKLTPKQELFCNEYLIDLNATQAAIRAGYSEKTARSTACEYLAKPNIQDRVAELNQKRINKVQIDADFVLKELYKIATSDVSTCFDDDGNLISIKEMPEPIRKAISSFEVQEVIDRDTGEATSYIKKVKLWSKDKSLENLGKHLKLFTDKVEHNVGASLEEILTKSRE